jgi:hypothetical protein
LWLCRRGPSSVIFTWPRYPTHTKLGKLSLAKTAGKPLPWLSANVVNNMARHQYRWLVTMWREHIQGECEGVYDGTFPVQASIIINRRRGYNMDSFAVLEGAKPIIDGIVAAGVIPGDDQQYVVGGTGFCAFGDPRILVVLWSITAPSI